MPHIKNKTTSTDAVFYLTKLSDIAAPLCGDGLITCRREQRPPEGGVDLGTVGAGGRTVRGTKGHGTVVVAEHPREGRQRSVYNI